MSFNHDWPYDAPIEIANSILKEIKQNMTKKHKHHLILQVPPIIPQHPDINTREPKTKVIIPMVYKVVGSPKNS